MAVDGPEGARELRLEGPLLLAIGGVLLALLAGAFYLGRWVERLSAPPAAVAADPLKHVAEDPVAVTDKLSFFDTLSGPGKESEPRREIKPASAPAPATPRTETPSAAAGTGPWFVQVFAGRDRKAAEDVVKRIVAGGHAVRMETERDGAESLFKVRVGGFATREDADREAQKLRSEGQGGAFVVRPRG